MDQSANHILLRGNQPGAADRMRELLARTVQDHVSDQRSNAGAFEEIRQRLEGLEWLVKEVREREFTNLASHLDGLAGQLDETREKPPGWAESLAEHIEVLGTQVQPIAELPALCADLGVVSENVEQALPLLQAACDMIPPTLDGLLTQDQHLSKIQQIVVTLQQGMEAAAGRFNRLDKVIAEMSQRVGNIDTEISGVRGRIDQGFAVMTSKINQSMENVANQVEQRTEAVSARVEQGLAAISAREDDLAANIAGITGHLDLLGGQVQVVHGRIERLDDRLGDQDDQLDAIDNKLGATTGKLGALDNRLERLDERLDDQYDRVSVVTNKLETVDTRLERIDGRLAEQDGQFVAINSKLSPVEGRFCALDNKLAAVEGKVGVAGGKLDGVDSKIEAVDEKFGTVDRKLDEVDGSLGALREHVSAVGTRLDAVDQRLRQLPASHDISDTRKELVQLTSQSAAELTAKLGALDERQADSIACLAEELRTHPGQAEFREVVAKIIDAAQVNVADRLGSLEETVLSLAEALLRPSANRTVLERREGNRI